MRTIILESVLFVALIATAAALLYFVVMSFTPVGRWRTQVRNRHRILRDAERDCPIHGMHEEHALVVLSNGERVCPECFKETVDGKLD